MTSPPDGQWGIEGKNKSWTGLVGQLQHRVSTAQSYLVLFSTMYENVSAHTRRVFVI